MSQFSYEIVHKKGLLHSNADGLSRMTYKPTKVPTPALRDALVDHNFVSAVDREMKESDFYNWLVHLSSKEEESFQFGSDLINYTAAIGVSNGEGPLEEERAPLVEERAPLIRVVPPLIAM